MRPDDRTKLDQCLTILDSTDLGLSLVWLWTWSLLKDFMGDPEYTVLVSEEEAWNILAKYVESGDGFTLEYGPDEHYDHLLDFATASGIIEYKED